MNTRLRVMLPVLAVMAGLAGSGVAEAQPYAYQPVPPPRYEVVPPVPGGPRMVWQQGAWEWTGSGYVWQPGHYVMWRPHYRHWIPGHWAYRGPRPFWVPAHWG